jgi:hypothetical protein
MHIARKIIQLRFCALSTVQDWVSEELLNAKKPEQIGLFGRHAEPWANHRKLLIRITSLLWLPRVSASCLPSRDQVKSKMSPDAKCVICFGGPPVSFCSQMLDTPFLVNTYSTASPPGAHRGSPAVGGQSNWYNGVALSKGITFS